MFNAKNYSDKLPKTIRQPLQQFAGNDCLLVKRWSDDFGLEAKEGNCHFNVKGYIDALGGEMVNGWLLCRSKQMMKVGMWVWSFHSVWLTDENELLDVTEDEQYKNNAFTTFLPDVARKVDLDEGINYNNIVIFENEAFAKHYGNSIGVDVKAGVVYWMSEDMMRLKELTEHSGQYRWLHKGYIHNHSMLYEKYGIAIVDDRVVKLDAANDNLSADVLFDFSLSCAA
jgi:hypothetical protein